MDSNSAVPLNMSNPEKKIYLKSLGMTLANYCLVIEHLGTGRHSELTRVQNGGLNQQNDHIHCMLSNMPDLKDFNTFSFILVMDFTFSLMSVGTLNCDYTGKKRT